MDYRKRILLLVLVTSIARLYAATALELGNDEVYYAGYAQHLQWNYFDHPPMVALWIRLTTFNLYLQQQEGFIRLGAIIAAGISTILLWQTGKILQSERAGWLAAVMYNASVYAGIISGVFILPDSPQILFWCLALYAAARLLRKGTPVFADWLLWGVATGLCIMSKVHGAFLWTGIGFYILCYRRSWLTQPGLYVSMALTALIISPILWWNIANDFATWRFHSARVSISAFRLNTDGFLREIAGQLLYNNPINVILIFFVLWKEKRRRRGFTEPIRLMLLIALPMILLLLGIAAFRDTLPHWSGPAWSTLILPVAMLIDRQNWQKVKQKCIWLAAALLLNIIVLAIGCWAVNHYPGTMSKANGATLGEGDPTLDMYGWRQLGKQFDSVRIGEIRLGKTKSEAVLLCNKWFPAAHLDHYVSHYHTPALVAQGPLEDIHHYHWLNAYRPALKTGDDAWCIIPSNNRADAQVLYGKQFTGIDSVAVVPISRGGKPVKHFTIYLMHGYKSVPQP